MKKIAVLLGDGCGPEIIQAGLKVLDKISDVYNLKFEYNFKIVILLNINRLI